MNSRILALVALVALVATSSALAQLVKIPIEPGAVPSAPLVKPVPNGSAWTIAVTTAFDLKRAEEKKKGLELTPEPKGGFEMKKMDGAFSSGISQASIQYGNGGVRAFYRKGNLEIFLNPRTGKIQAEAPQPSDEEGGVCNASGQFPELSWVSGRFYLGTAAFGERRCNVYRRYLRRGEENASEESSRRFYTAGEAKGFPAQAEFYQTAYIDQANGLPVALEQADAIWRYQFRMEKEPFVLPPDYLKAFDDAIAGATRLQRKYQIPQ